ncbi:putative ABC1 protein At2g40090 [Hordeum vulgare subsp. vulgare]|uniref:ABC1 atypical kinase-like domain-containing protein n=1 Tax=Hordeum vulgare subsp. vulgare TaxID=112509 RepID=A0A8I6WY56_HORVV|nr:putative ABC1 protein At2g40090 [Hordeum vulgare subsp. vulgare]
MWRRAATAALALGAGAGAHAVATSEDPARTLKICRHLPPRLLRDSVAAATIAFDYHYSLWGLQPDSPAWLTAKRDAHLRSAHRLQDLCFRNGGIYIKLGQHIAQLEYVLPQEYVQTMRESMLKRCPVSSYEDVQGVFKKEIGELPETVFAEFDPVPLASASLAQVHAATTHDGKKVAVKVQHDHLLDTSVIDIATVDLVVNALSYIFPTFDYRWLVDEIRESAPKELDFLCEAQNSERCLVNFRKLSPHIANSIYTPKVYWNLSTSRILTMEYIDAKEVTDVKGIKDLGMRPVDVSNLVNKAFAEMIFKHGFVHCDPHAANMMIRPLPQDSKKWFGSKRPQLVLLDHGLYKELDHATRINYASLWKALVRADENGIKEYSIKLGAGEDLHVLFAGVLTMRPWKSVIDPSFGHLVLDGNNTDRSEMQMYANLYFPQISELLRRLPNVILLMLKTNDCLRAVNHALVGGSTPESFEIVARVSSEAVFEAKRMEKRFFLYRFIIWLEELLMEFHLLKMKLWLHYQQPMKLLAG